MYECFSFCLFLLMCGCVTGLAVCLSQKKTRQTEAERCVRSSLSELPYKAVAVRMKINLSAPISSLNNSLPVSHVPVATPTA